MNSPGYGYHPGNATTGAQYTSHGSTCCTKASHYTEDCHSTDVADYAPEEPRTLATFPAPSENVSYSDRYRLARLRRSCRTSPVMRVTSRGARDASAVPNRFGRCSIADP